MLLEEFNQWKKNNWVSESWENFHDDDLLEAFISEKYTIVPANVAIAALAKQIYHLQICVEGLLEDQNQEPPGKCE